MQKEIYYKLVRGCGSVDKGCNLLGSEGEGAAFSIWFLNRLTIEANLRRVKEGDLNIKSKLHVSGWK